MSDEALFCFRLFIALIVTLWVVLVFDKKHLGTAWISGCTATFAWVMFARSLFFGETLL